MAVVLSGCTMGSIFGGSDDANYANVTPSQAQIAQAASVAAPAIASDCPVIRIRPGADTYRSYAENRITDPSALRYQAVIDTVSRDCVAASGQVRLTMDAAGRIIPGPFGSGTATTVPVRFSVHRDGLIVFSERYDVPVQAGTSSTRQFSYSVDNVAIPFVGGETITLWVGFDN